MFGKLTAPHSTTHIRAAVSAASTSKIGDKYNRVRNIYRDYPTSIRTTLGWSPLSRYMYKVKIELS
jgi:hypothetical protein